MISFFIPLLGSFLSSAWVNYFFFPCIAIAFLATVPCLIRYFVR